MDSLHPVDGPPPLDRDSLYETAPCGLMVTSADGIFLRVNHTFCQWVGREPAALLGRARFQDLLSMGGRIFHQTHWNPLLQLQGSVSEVKFEVVHADGRRIPMVLNAVRRVRGGAAHHEISAFVAEDRHKYERELLIARTRAEDLLAKEQAAQQAVLVAQEERDLQKRTAEDRALFAEQMMAIVSHDLRNPLSVIRMSTHLLGMGELSSNQMKALERLSSSTLRATRLIADLLDFSQARMGGGLQLRVASVDLHLLVTDSVEELRLAFPDRSLEVVHRGSGSCAASADRLFQLIGNLVSNAMAYGDPAKPVVVTSDIGPNSFALSVHNQGPTIPPDALPSLFDPMTRGASADERTHSVGMGLFIVREIVRAHGGAVAVTSTAAEGTLFTATIPRQVPQHDRRG